ncbi:hypothetical protein HELRODRAFT_165263 [Helobdella robusta]|uniref:Uncharacterized protein n=1 Tax=Helobdella robusta TaxID=6412 RepID=T1EWI6_HELRO|nr:hypothetical protein HELRODRAFT_165263 [Helobdella robusta]ESN93103.1 hypothetical protein HELRODRAFT_165263 [Helobdella robusta]
MYDDEEMLVAKFNGEKINLARGKKSVKRREKIVYPFEITCAVEIRKNHMDVQLPSASNNNHTPGTLSSVLTDHNPVWSNKEVVECRFSQISNSSNIESVEYRISRISNQSSIETVK